MDKWVYDKWGEKEERLNEFEDLMHQSPIVDCVLVDIEQVMAKTTNLQFDRPAKHQMIKCLRYLEIFCINSQNLILAHSKRTSILLSKILINFFDSKVQQDNGMKN